MKTSVRRAEGLTIVVGVLDSGVRPLELSEGSLCGHEMLVGAHLADLSLHQDQDEVRLRQVAQSMCHQHTGLHTCNTL